MTTKKQIPTINKVKEMINESFPNLTSTTSTRKWIYKIKNLESSYTVYNYGQAINDVQPSYYIDSNNSIYLYLKQKDNIKRPISICDSSKNVLFPYEDNVFQKDYIYNEGTQIYEAEARINILEVKFIADINLTPGLYTKNGNDEYELVLELQFEKEAITVNSNMANIKWKNYQANVDIIDMCYGNTIYIGIDSENKMYYSANTKTWYQISVNNASNWKSIYHFQDYFIAEATNTTDNNVYMFYSKNGIDWTQLRQIDRNYKYCYGNGVLMGISDNYIGFSTDFINTWQSLDWGYIFCDVCFANDMFCVVSSNGPYTGDGITEFYVKNNNNNIKMTKICYGNGTFFGIKVNGTLSKGYTSTDGETWTAHEFPFYIEELIDLCFYDNAFVIKTSTRNIIYYSLDLNNWYIASIEPVVNFRKFAPYNGILYILDQNKIITSGTSIPIHYSSIYEMDKSIEYLDNTLATRSATINEVEEYFDNFNLNTKYKTKYDIINRIENIIYKKPPPWEVKFTTLNEIEIDGLTGNKRICCGDGIFVCISDETDNIYYSSDISNWTAVKVPHSCWYNICYSSSLHRFIVIGKEYYYFLYSDDGKTWTEIDNTNNSTFAGKNPAVWGYIAYGDGYFYATSKNWANFVFSADGLNWTHGTLDTILNELIYDNKKFIAIAKNYPKIIENITTSTYEVDGQTYYEGKYSKVETYYGIMEKIVGYKNTSFLTVGKNGKALLFSDINNLRLIPIPVFNEIRALKYMKYMGLVFIVSDIGIHYSFDLYNWCTFLEGDYSDIYLYGEKIIIAGTDNKIIYNEITSILNPNNLVKEKFKIYPSTWTKTDINFKIKGVCYGDGKYYCITSVFNEIYYSSDFINWTLSEPSSVYSNYSDDYYQDIIYYSDYNRFIVSFNTDGSSSNFLYTKSGNTTWYTGLGGTYNYSSIACCGNYFIVITDSMLIMELKLGNYRKVEPLITPQDICSGAGKFVIISKTDDSVSYSKNVSDWTAFSESVDDWSTSSMKTVVALKKICYGNNLFFAVGTSGKAATSLDGIYWNVKTMPVFNEIRRLRYFNRFFFAVTDTGIYYTHDCENWNTLYEGTTDECYDLIYIDNKLWIVGYANYVLSTTITLNDPINIRNKILPANTII